MKVFIVCTCHPTSFIQHANPLTLPFNVKSKMATDMLLPVMVSELVDSEDEKLRLGKTLEWIGFLNLSFFFFSVAFVSFLSSACLFSRYLQLLLLHLSILPHVIVI